MGKVSVIRPARGGATISFSGRLKVSNLVVLARTHLFFLKSLVVQFHVPRKVVLQDAEHDNGQEGRQKENQDKGIDDREPMNFEGGRNEATFRVTRESIFPFKLFRIPFHRVGELNSLWAVHVGNVDSSVHLQKEYQNQQK